MPPVPPPHVEGPGGVNVPPPAQVFAELVGTVTLIVALVALIACAVNDTPPAGSLNVCPTAKPSNWVVPFVEGFMSRIQVRRPSCVRAR
jgi:hypothetical protein